jgi:hypothetical protein
VRVSRTVSLQQPVDFRDFEPADLKIDVSFELEDVGKLQGQQIPFPPGIFAHPVESNTKDSELRVSQSRKGHGRNLLARLSGRKDQTPASHHSIALIDDDREHEAELLDTCLELANMAGGCLLARSTGMLSHGLLRLTCPRDFGPLIT